MVKIPNTNPTRAASFVSQKESYSAAKIRTTVLPLADGSTLSTGTRRTVTLAENESSPNITANELPTFADQILFQVPTYTDRQGSNRSVSLYAAQLANGDIIYFAQRYNTQSVSNGYETTGRIYVLPVNGDIQTVIDRRFQQDIVDGAIGNLLKTPRRVTELPSEASAKEGETVYVDADYSHANGVNVSAQEFAGTELDSATNSDAQAGIGDRGWYAKADAGFQFGQIYPALPDDFVLISNARVYVKRNTQTNLSKIYLGETSYALTRVPQPAGTKIINNPAFAASEPDVDYYTITGGLPSGDWDALRFETTTAGTFVPASSKVEKGLYQFENSDWVQAGFFAPLAQPDKDFTISVEEERPGVKANKAVTVAASGSTFTAADPFPGIARLTYNNDSNETELYQRFSVNVSLTGFEDSKAPAVLQLGSVNYSLSYFETDAGIAVYRTPKIKASEQVSAAGAIASVNIQLKNGSWAGQSGATKVLRTINKGELQAAANAALPVHQAPHKPGYWPAH